MLPRPAMSIDDTASRHSFGVIAGTGDTPVVDTIIIGSGMTGVTCARMLTEAGQRVHVLDKGRGVGGRMATRLVETASETLTFDHGAQYLRPRNPEFAKVLAQAGARPWLDGPENGGYVGVPGMSDIPRVLAQGLRVSQQVDVTTIAWRSGAWSVGTTVGTLHADRVVMTIPAPQVMALLGREHPFCAELRGVVMAPCLTLMAVFPRNSPRPFAHRHDPSHPLAWVAQDGTKPDRAATAVTWVAQANSAFSDEHLDASPDDIAARMLPLLAELLGTEPELAVYTRAHRWRYAQASAPLGQPFLRNHDRTLYAGGDWCLGPCAEDAWHSGRAMAHDILDSAHVD